MPLYPSNQQPKARNWDATSFVWFSFFLVLLTLDDQKRYNSREYSPTFIYIQGLLFIMDWKEMSDFVRLTRLKLLHVTCLTKPNLEGEKREEEIQSTAHLFLRMKSIKSNLVFAKLKFYQTCLWASLRFLDLGVWILHFTAEIFPSRMGLCYSWVHLPQFCHTLS